MFFLLLALDFILYGTAVLLFISGERFYGWIALGSGVLVTVLIFLYYRRLKKKKDDSWEDCCSVIECLDCAASLRPLRKLADCDCLPGCDC